MCKANGKQWNDYWRTDRATAYLEALSADTGISVSNLCLSLRGGNIGTWVHPQVAIDLARWISAPFAVWMDRWFLESLQAPEQSVPQLPAAVMLALVKDAVSLFEQLGGLDERDQLLFKDIVRSNILSASAGSVQALPGDEEMALSDAWLEVTGSPLPRDAGTSVGRLVAALYREEFEQEPPTRTQFVDGAPRKVKSYKRSWLIEAVRMVWPRMKTQ